MIRRSLCCPPAGRRIPALLFLLPLLLAPLPCAAEEALDVYDYQAVRRAEPDDLSAAGPFVERAAAAYESGKLAAAQRLFEEALRRAVRPQWYFALGQVLRDRQSWTGSRKAFLLAALFGFRRQELAYYQAARSAAEGGSVKKALSYLETALLAGLRPRARLLDDPALAGLHGREGYWSLLDLYFPPQRADSPSSAARAVPAEERAAVTADMSGNGMEELVLLFRFSRIAAPEREAYYFVLYRRAGAQWRLVNRTVSRLRSLPALGEHSALFERHAEAAGGEAVRPFIPLELDGRAGEELVVPSVGSGGEYRRKGARLAPGTAR